MDDDPVALWLQIECVEREIAMRRRVYPNAVATGRMRQDKAFREIAHMQAVLATLKALPGADAPKTLL